MKRGPADSARARPGEVTGEPWYVTEGKRGQQLLDRGDAEQAREVFSAILEQLGDAPNYGRAVILERLGRCLHVGGHPELALARFRDALTTLGRLAPSDGVRSLRGTLRSELGDAFRALGHLDEARKAYEAALKISEESRDLEAQAIELDRLGTLALIEGKYEEAVTRHRRALSLCQQVQDSAAEAAAWYQLARVFQQQGQWTEAERHYQEAVRLDRRIGNAEQLERHLSALADMLQRQPDRVAEARQLVEEALGIAQTLDPAGSAVWSNFGLLASVIEKEAIGASDDRREALLAQARDHRHLQQYAPRFLATLARLGDAPSYGRVVILERLGRCFQMSGRPDLAEALLVEALGVAEKLPAGDGVKGLQGTLHSVLGDVLRVMARLVETQKEYESALEIAEELQDVLGQDEASSRLGKAYQPSASPDDRDVVSSIELTLYDDVTTDYVFDADLLIEGRRVRKITRWSNEQVPLPDEVRPTVAPGARTWVDEHGAIRFTLAPGEPIVEPHSGCTVMRRTRREVAVSGASDVIWQLIRRMDGTATAAEILSDLPRDEQAPAARLIASLAAAGVVDASGRAIGRFMHSATKKGVLPAGGLESDEVLQLATDGGYRTYAEAERFAVSQSVPERLRAFHALTRERRSCRDYGGLSVSRADFDALLHGACGVTGAMTWMGREVKLRAYPSSGALYAVEIYPVVFRVEGLEEAVYHYRVVENQLERVKSLDRVRFVAAALPVERQMVASAAAMVCLAGVFPRHERKYGEGGYRMMVAEAGHISQNLILAATALSLSARPFGGVFDDLLNRDLGFSGEDEQFLLAVLVGHAPSPIRT
jgi:SagB-type dehydrogenase family enzyme